MPLTNTDTAALADYHLHTRLCRHAEGDPEAYVAAAVAAGLTEIGFADHSPWPEDYDSQFRMTAAEFPEYRRLVETAADRTAIAIRLGVEVDWVPGRMDGVARKLAIEKLDYIIGSIHYVDGFPFDNPDTLGEWKMPGTADKIWRRYAENMKEFVAGFDFDIIAHCDLPKKFGFRPEDPAAVLELFDQAFAIAADKNMAIEINTSGLRKPAGETYPSLDILKAAKRRGLAITFGSDAHHPSETAADFNAAIDLAKAAGFQKSAFFHQRQMTLKSLP